MKSLLAYPHIGILILAWFVADLAVPTLISLAHRIGVLDRPGGHDGKVQDAPIPFFGGLGILLGFSVALFSTLRFESLEAFIPFLVLISGAAVVATLGLLDDHRPISAMVKLGVLFGITLTLSAFGVEMHLLPNAFNGWVDVVLTLLWIVGVISATNSLDNTDGVVGGISAIAGAFIFLIAWGSSSVDSQPWLSYLAVALIGSSLGFLRYNFPPARVYLGDNGSFLLGFILATTLVFAEYSIDPIRAVLIPCLILVVPIYDITLSTILRIRDGDVKNWREAVHFCGQDHLAHLLMGHGLSKRQAVICLYCLGLAGGITALAIHRIDSRTAAIAIATIFGAGLVWIGVFLGRVRTEVAASEIPASIEGSALSDRPRPEHLVFSQGHEAAAQQHEKLTSVRGETVRGETVRGETVRGESGAGESELEKTID